MISRRLLTIIILLTSTIWSQAQQINPVPDYVFRNQMSVGRNAVTDTAAYFSIGPRYGATKGFMPPIVGDTAIFSSGKRNGLLIFSVQKNKFLYWDSVRVQWSDMAGSSGAYIVAGDTSAMLAPYLRKADTTAMLSPYFRKADTTTLSNRINLKLNISDTSSMLGNYVRHAGYGLTKTGQSFLVDTLNIATRAWRQKGLDSLAALEVSGSGTTNYVSKFTASSTIGNSQIFDNGTNVGIGITTGMSERFNVASSTANANASISSSWASGGAFLRFGNSVNADGLYLGYNNPAGTLFGGIGGANSAVIMGYGSYPIVFGTNATERLRIFANGRVFVGASPTDAGYQFDVNGDGRFQGTLYTRAGTAVGIQMDNTSAIRNAGTQYFDYGTGGTGDFYIRGGSGYSNFLTLLNGGNVGISTASPSYKLDVNGTLRSVNGANFATTSGNVGIGTTTSAWSFSGNMDLGNDNNIFGGNTALGIGVNAYYDGAWKYKGTGAATYIKQEAGSFQFYSSSSGTAGNAITFTRPMTLTSASELIINSITDAGDYKLQVSGNVLATDVAGSYPRFVSQVGAKYWEMGYRSGTTNFEIREDGTTRFIIDNGGEVFINTDSDAGDYKLQVSGNIYNTGSAVLAATSGKVGIGTTSPGSEFIFDARGRGAFQGTTGYMLDLVSNDANATKLQFYLDGNEVSLVSGGTAVKPIKFYLSGEKYRFNTDGELWVNTQTDAGDYKLQVVGNARVGTGKLDIASNTTFGLGVARSGTSEVAGQIYNSSGILYLGAESSTGGQIFSGSSAYAAVIGSGAAYPLQFAVNNTVRGGFNTNGELMINTTNDQGDYVIQANGSVYNTGQVTRGLFSLIGYNSQLSIDSTKDLAPIFIGQHQITTASAQPTIYANTTWNTTGSPTMLSFDVINTASGSDANWLRISDGVQVFKITKDGGLFTGTPTGGSSKKWRLGSAATVSPTSPNRTIQVEVDGVIYYLHAKTTND